MRLCILRKDSHKLWRSILLSLALCGLLMACQNQAPSSDQLPTLVRFPTLTATIHPSESSTAIPTLTASATSTPSATATDTPLATATERLQPLATDTITPTLSPSPTLTATPLPETFIFGQSAGGRDLVAYRHGEGSHVIMLIGGIHAGFEANTIDLVTQLREHFQNNPRAIEPDITIILIPILNPDGQSQGRVLAGRFNGNAVDLNRNWGCGWSPNAQFADNIVDAGEAAFSEPETSALGSLIQRVNPAAVIFYHSAANGVFSGDCGESEAESDALGAIYGEASGYPFGSDFESYPVTGTGPGWVHSIGIPALDVELASAQIAEFDRNLRAIMLVQQWVLR